MKFNLPLSAFKALLLVALFAPLTAPMSVSGLETGPSDFRISNSGPALDPDFRGANPNLAFNVTDNEFLVVWSANQHPIEPVFETEIFAQRLHGDTGAALGAPIRISQMGPDTIGGFGNKGEGGEPAFLEALEPAVAWNSEQNEYLVVWWGDDNTPPLVDNKREVFGRRLNGDGQPLAAQFRISFMGSDGDPLAEGSAPEVIYNPAQQEYFVVWQGDNINGVFVDQESEIWGQRITAVNGEPLGSVIRISDMGEADGDASFTAADPDIAITSSGGTYLVVWEGDDDGGSAVDGEQEVYGQLLDASTGAEIGPNDIRISELGPIGATNYDAGNAVAAFNPITGQFLVAFNGSDDDDGTVRNDLEIYVQGLATNGALAGDPRRISAMGPDGVDTYWGIGPQIQYDPAGGEFLVVWSGEDDAGDLVPNEFEIYGTALTGSGENLRPRRRLTRMGPDGSSMWLAGNPRLARNPISQKFLLVFNGSDDRVDLAPREFEVFGQFLLLDIIQSTSFE